MGATSFGSLSSNLVAPPATLNEGPNSPAIDVAISRRPLRLRRRHKCAPGLLHADGRVHVEPRVRPGEHAGGLVLVEEIKAYEDRSTARRNASVNRAVSCTGHVTNVPSGAQRDPMCGSKSRTRMV